MSTFQIIALGLGALLGLAVLLYAVMFLRMLRTTARPIPIPTGGQVRTRVEDLALRDSAPEPAMNIHGPVTDDTGHTPRPVVLFVPGDGPDWLLRGARRWGMFRSYAELCAARGWLAAVTSHRSSGSYRRSADMVQDVRDALARLRERAPELGADMERVLVWTFSGSAGPVLADLCRDPVPGVRGLVSFYGLLDLSAWPMKLPEEVVQAGSLPPLLASAEALPCPLYLLHAGRDRKMMVRGFEATEAALAGRALPVTCRVHASGRHGFEVLDDPAETAAEIERALDFAASCLDEET